MKKYLVLLIGLLIFVGCSDNSTNVDKPIEEPQGFYKLDLKTRFDDKYDMQGLKAGLITYVDKYSSWCTKVEYGEDYSIWLEDVSRVKITATEWEVSFLLSVSEPSSSWKKGVYKAKRIKLRYEIPLDIESYPETYDKYLKLLQKCLQLTNKYGIYEPHIKVFSIVGLDILTFMNECKNEFEDKEVTNARKAEALFCGQAIGEILKLWFVDYEKNGGW